MLQRATAFRYCVLFSTKSNKKPSCTPFHWPDKGNCNSLEGELDQWKGVHVDAACKCNSIFVVLYVFCVLCLLIQEIGAFKSYTLSELLCIKVNCGINREQNVLYSNGTTIHPVRRLRQRKGQEAKQDKRAGIHAKLQAKWYKSVLPSLFITNSCPLTKKLNIIRTRIPSYKRDTWLNEKIWFDSTDWFQKAELEEYIPSVLSYINFCTETFSIQKMIKVFPNQRPE